MTTQKIGYGRVSTLDQNLDSQADTLKAAGVDKLFIEKITGTVKERPELDKLREQLRPGDTLVITRLDRLGRSTKDLLAISSELEEKMSSWKFWNKTSTPKPLKASSSSHSWLLSQSLNTL